MNLELKNVEIYNKNKKLFTDLNLKIESGKLYPLVYSKADNEHEYIFRYLLNLRGEFSGKINFAIPGQKNYHLITEKVGFLPEKGGYYPEMNGFEQFDLFSKLYSDFSLDKAREIAYEFKIPLEMKLKKMPDFQRRLILISAILATQLPLLFLEVPLTHMPGGEASLLQYIFREELKNERAILLTLSEDKIERYQFSKYYLLKSQGIEITKTQRDKETIEDKEQNDKIKKIPVWDNEKAFLVDHKKIRWISTYKGKSTLHTKDKEYNVNLLLRELEERLDFPPFFRCHRSYIINLNYIEEVITWFNGTYNLKIGDEKIPVSRSNVKELEKILGM